MGYEACTWKRDTDTTRYQYGDTVNPKTVGHRDMYEIYMTHITHNR